MLLEARITLLKLASRLDNIYTEVCTDKRCLFNEGLRIDSYCGCCSRPNS